MSATTNTAANAATSTAVSQRPVRAVSRRRVRATAVVTAVLVNSVLYLGARALGTDFQITDPGKTEAHQFVLPEIALFTAFFALLGWGSLAVLERVTRRAKAVWTMLAGTVLVLSFVPIGIEQATPATRAMLAVIHIAVAVALVPMLRTPARPRG
jgi:heme A synthase